MSRLHRALTKSLIAVKSAGEIFPPIAESSPCRDLSLFVALFSSSPSPSRTVFGRDLFLGHDFWSSFLWPTEVPSLAANVLSIAPFSTFGRKSSGRSSAIAPKSGSLSRAYGLLGGGERLRVGRFHALNRLRQGGHIRAKRWDAFARVWEDFSLKCQQQLGGKVR